MHRTQPTPAHPLPHAWKMPARASAATGRTTHTPAPRRHPRTYQSRARLSNESPPGGKHFTTHLEGALHARDPTNTPPTHSPKRLYSRPTHCLVLVPAAAASPPTPGRQLRAAHVKKITAPPQTFQHTPRGSPARTGPTHHHSRTRAENAVGSPAATRPPPRSSPHHQPRAHRRATTPTLS